MPLGQGDHTVFLYDRGGLKRIAQITNTTTVRWSRVRDDISNATVIVSSPGPDCCAALRDAAVGRHELVIFRNDVRVWEGPLTLLTFKATTIEITAHDICHYLSRTIMRGVYDNRYSAKASKVGPITTRLNTIIRNELKRKESLDPPVNILPYLWVSTNASTARTSRLNAAYESTVWEELDAMAYRSGVDYTTIGRRLMIFDVDDVIGRLPLMTDNDFNNELVISSYGMELCTYSAVSNGEGIWGAVGVGDSTMLQYTAKVWAARLVQYNDGVEAQRSTLAQFEDGKLKAYNSEQAKARAKYIIDKKPNAAQLKVYDAAMNVRIAKQLSESKARIKTFVDSKIPGRETLLLQQQAALAVATNTPAYSLHPFYGEQELLSTNYSDNAIQPVDPKKPTAAELASMVKAMQSQAQRNLTGRLPTPLIVRVPENTGLNPNYPIDINDLVPGIRVPIRATLTCIELQQEQKLNSVTVEQTEAGETISVILGPAPGSSPWAGNDASDVPEAGV